MKWIIGPIAAAVLLSGCVSQNEVALSKDVYRIDVDARGLIGVDVARKSFEKRVSSAVLAKGYTHYKILAYGSQKGSIYAGNTPMYANTNVNFIGNTAYGTTNIYGGDPINVPTSQTSVVVQMFRSPNVPGDAIRAQDQIAKAAQPNCVKVKVQGDSKVVCN